jgi:polyisoprenoid-binding protein YceI
MKLQPTSNCHSERSEESLINFGSVLLKKKNGQRCFASLNMTAFFIKGFLCNVISAIVIAGFCAVASAKDNYKFDPAGSTIGFSVHQFLGTTRGKFTSFSGRIEVDREHPENSSVTTQIDVRSIDTRIKKRDDHLRSAEFFDVEKFPRITFRSRSVKRTGSQSGDILGDLTMHGVTKQITLHVKLLTPTNETGRTRWSVTTDPITRRDFNLMFTPAAESVSGISQTVAINIEIEAKRGD